MSIGLKPHSVLTERTDARSDQCARGLKSALTIVRAGVIVGVLMSLAGIGDSHRVVAAEQPDESEPKKSLPMIIPVFEKKHALRYNLPLPPVAVIRPAEDFDRPAQQYQFMVAMDEHIRRGARKSTIRISGNGVVLLAAKPDEQSGEYTPFGEFDEDGRFCNTFTMLMYPVSFDATKRAGTLHRRFVLSSTDGLSEEQQHEGVSSYQLVDRIIGTQSLLAAMSHPSMTLVRNGAVRRRPSPGPVLEFTQTEWLDQVLFSLLPPLPEEPIPTGQTWQAGFLLTPSLYAEPMVVRGDLRFEMFDTETGMATVTWEAETASLPIRPIKGIHHVQADAIARIEVNGRFTIHAGTGWIQSGHVEMTSKVINPSRQTVSATYSMRASLKGISEPGAVRADKQERQAQMHNPIFPGAIDD